MKIIDTTLRDGAQSLWSMKMTYRMYDAVLDELDRAGYDHIDIPMHAPYMITPGSRFIVSQAACQIWHE